MFYRPKAVDKMDVESGVFVSQSSLESLVSSSRSIRECSHTTQFMVESGYIQVFIGVGGFSIQVYNRVGGFSMQVYIGVGGFTLQIYIEVGSFTFQVYIVVGGFGVLV